MYDILTERYPNLTRNQIKAIERMYKDYYTWCDYRPWLNIVTMHHWMWGCIDVLPTGAKVPTTHKGYA